MAQLRPFRFKIFGVMRVRLSTNRHLLDHFEPIALKTDNFLRIICEEPELPHAEIEKDLRPQSVIAQVARITKFNVGLHGIEALLLQLVRVDFGCQSDSASFLTHVNQHAVAFLCDLSERGVQLNSAIASARSKNVAGKTLTVHTHERRLLLVNFAFDYSKVMLPIQF